MKAKACPAMSSLSDQMSRQAATMLARVPPAADAENASKAIVLSYPIRGHCHVGQEWRISEGFGATMERNRGKFPGGGGSQGR
jgi:hypothetical protein